MDVFINIKYYPYLNTNYGDRWWKCSKTISKNASVTLLDALWTEVFVFFSGICQILKVVKM